MNARDHIHRGELHVSSGTMASDTFHIVRHDPLRLQDERARLFDMVRNATVIGTLLEVGSTAVEGVIGKEDIDFALIVPAQQFNAARADLDRHFDRDLLQFSSDDYQGYRLTSAFDAAIQLTISGSQFDTFETFLARLRQNASLRQAYNDLKAEWHGRSMDDYRAAKHDFIEAALKQPA
jgi:GrpB-like predicted nucleotidyltransferase (UPF0157 family)